MWTPEAGIPTLRKIPYGARSRYSGGTVYQRHRPEASIPDLQLKNNLFHETANFYEQILHLDT